MGTRRGVCFRSIGDPPRPVSGSVTLDPSSIKRYAGTAMRWLMLLMSLPPTPTRHRVGVWRKRQLDRILAVDYLDTPAGPRARKLWETTATRLRAAETRPRAARGRHRASLPPHGSTWVTRPRPHIDRIASAWLIRRFYDQEAKFAFADAADASRKGIPFDVLGADFGHHGEDCT